MATWDVFHTQTLEIERSIPLESVREALIQGRLSEEDLIRPARTSDAWVRLMDFPPLLNVKASPKVQASSQATPTPPSLARERQKEEEKGGEGQEESVVALPVLERDDEPAEDSFPPEENQEESVVALPVLEEKGNLRDVLDVGGPDDSAVALPATGEEDEPPDFADWPDDEDDDEASQVALPATSATALPRNEHQDWLPELTSSGANDWGKEEEEDESIAGFTLARGSAETVEELDLAAMVDVAFQLVLFFLVTATTVLYKSLEVPKPNPESPASAATQGRSRSLEELQQDFILVEIDPAGTMKIDQTPVGANMAELVGRLRDTREKTGRKAMLLSADFATPHRNAVLAYDAANEIGLEIAIARPRDPALGAPPPPRKAAQG